MTDGSSEKQTARELVASASRIVGFTGAASRRSRVCQIFGVRRAYGRETGLSTSRNSYRARLIGSNTGGRRWRVGPPCATRARTPGTTRFVALHTQGKLQAMITQNIERLHQRSGLPADLVLELHGTTTEAVCLTCGDRIPSDEACRRVAGGELAPRCKACGGLLKPATVSFGQAMPHDVMVRAYAAAESCDLLLAVGSSLVVEPAASIPRIAKRASARLIIVNRESTPLDVIADVVMHGEIGAILPALV